MAVCGFCRSTLVRHDADLENLGTMATLAEDRSPFRLRFRGRYGSVGFELIGRLQLKYAQGYWNEWYARLDDGRLGWVSEGSGLCYVTFEQTLKTQLPPITEFSVGQTAKLGGKPYTVTNIEAAECVAIEGELPFRAAPGYAAPAVDLRSDAGFASLDYSEDPPKVYIGEAVTLDTLLDPAAPTDTPKVARAEARAFKCSSCGAPLSVRGPDIRAVGCAHCGAVVDPDDANLKILSRVVEKLAIPKLPVGSQGKLQGRAYTVIGFMRRATTVEGIRYSWDEYLLHAADAGYAWLTEYNGHWNFAKPLTRLPSIKPATQPVARFLDRDYKHYQRSQAEVTQVIGEFNWQVKVGDKASCDDYVSPPYLLSAERSETELSWSLAEYVPHAVVAQAFQLPKPLPEPTGVAPNQPSPRESSAPYWLAYLAIAAIAGVVQFVSVGAAANKTVWQGRLDMPMGQPQHSMTSEPFVLEGGHNLAIRQETDVDNRWLYTELNLINRDTGESFRLGREVSFYRGHDSDGAWSEGSASDEALLADVPAGTYLLEIDAETEAHKAGLSDRITLVRDVPIWRNYWLLLGFLLLFPCWVWLRAASFEQQRWADSDYAPSGSDDDGDDD